ncbi:calcineurin-like phosphoesterase C-terminal domain-containing protein [Tomitella gaofuii]|uniref:calcineurin-like phosphoesterase C-terminal domain-containing protein n=1 Tax=Tomitella gaofuii TaxID=2760083 RepID=UPI001F1C54EC|nr:calcineurin-like phosphoesterase family protein [Tomitella gaofuii]
MSRQRSRAFGASTAAAGRAGVIGMSLTAVTLFAAPVVVAAPGAVQTGPAGSLGSLGSVAPENPPSGNEGLYTGSVQVVDGPAENAEVLTGHVFDDANRNSILDGGEAGIPGVQVSNGIDVAVTDDEGRYRLPVRDHFTAFVTQPAGWQVPVDEQMFAQFSYNHAPEGSPDLKFGGLEPTGPTPEAVNFPMAQSDATADPQQSCAIASDTQTYDKEEVEFARRGAVADLMARDDYASCGILLLGDNVGDDLSLNPDLRGLYENANGPVRALPGNHDMDYDAAGDKHALDTYRSDFGAPYYSYNVGETHFVALDNIIYNGTDAGDNGGYKEAISDEQLEWLKNDLKFVDKDQRIVVAAHAPIVNYTGVVTDNAAALYEILAGYPNAVTVGGHTHTLEHLLAGDTREEWAADGVPELTHDQYVAGAVSGSWYSGELNENGLPHAYTSDAAEPGVLTFEFDGSAMTDYYTVRNESQDRQFLTGLNSPTWRAWAEGAQQWQEDDKQGEAPADIVTDAVSVADVQTGDSYLTTSFYAGSSASEVTISLDGGDATTAQHTQPFEGESLNKGWEFTDPVSATHNLSSTGAVAQASPHLWRVALPEDLAAGEHTAEITATDQYGREYTESFTFTVDVDGPAVETGGEA